MCGHHVLTTSWALSTASIFLTIFTLSCKTAPWGRSVSCLRHWDFTLCVLFPCSQLMGSCQRPREGRDGDEAIRLEPGRLLCPSSSHDPGQATFLPFPEGHRSGQTAFLFSKGAEFLAEGKVFLAQQSGGCARSNSTPQFLSRYNTPVSKENSW